LNYYLGNAKKPGLALAEAGFLKSK